MLKYLLPILLASTAASAQSWINPATPVTLIVVAGQSNSTSRATETVYNNDLPVPGIYQLARTGAAAEPFIPAYEPLHHWDINPHGVGYAYAFAVEYKRTFRETLAILPAAKGETGLDPSQWGPGGKYSTDLARRVNYVAGKTYVQRCVFLWQQGEAEVVKHSTTYVKDMKAALAAMYDAAPTLRKCTFMIGGLADDFVNDHKPYSDAVVSGMKSAFPYVDTAGLATLDRTHFTPAAQRALAHRFFLAYRQVTGR